MRHPRMPVRCLVVAIGLAGCAVSDPTQYYALGQSSARRAESTASASIGSTPASRPDPAAAVSIGVGPVIIPGYLRRSQIVTRSGADHLELATFQRWAEPLEDGIARILAEQIGDRVPTERIVVYPWRGAIARALQYQVVVAVMRFDGSQGGDVMLDARWRILGKNGAELAFKRSMITDTAAGPGIQPVIAAMTRALVSLGQDIAGEIRALPR